jgi:hypothetical protein
MSRLCARRRGPTYADNVLEQEKELRLIQLLLTARVQQLEAY